MASFGVSMFDAGSMAGAAGAGLVNSTTAAAPAAAAGAIQLVAHVSPGVLTAFQVVGNFFSIVALFMPMRTYVRPVCGARRVGTRTIYNFLYVFFAALLWLLFAIASKPRTWLTWLTLIVNCVGIACQIFYIYIYLKNAVNANLTHSKCMVKIAAPITLVVLMIATPLLVISEPWRVKVLGIVASAFATGVSAMGLIDVVIVVKAQRTGFNMLQLICNLVSSAIWALYGFLFAPVNLYVVIPNLTSVVVSTIQIASHVVLYRKEERNAAPRIQSFKDREMAARNEAPA